MVAYEPPVGLPSHLHLFLNYFKPVSIGHIPNVIAIFIFIGVDHQGISIEGVGEYIAIGVEFALPDSGKSLLLQILFHVVEVFATPHIPIERFKIPDIGGFWVDHPRIVAGLGPVIGNKSRIRFSDKINLVSDNIIAFLVLQPEQVFSFKLRCNRKQFLGAIHCNNENIPPAIVVAHGPQSVFDHLFDLCCGQPPPVLVVEVLHQQPRLVGFVF